MLSRDRVLPAGHALLLAALRLLDASVRARAGPRLWWRRGLEVETPPGAAALAVKAAFEEDFRLRVLFALPPRLFVCLLQARGVGGGKDQWSMGRHPRTRLCGQYDLEGEERRRRGWARRW